MTPATRLSRRDRHQVRTERVNRKLAVDPSLVELPVVIAKEFRISPELAVDLIRVGAVKLNDTTLDSDVDLCLPASAVDGQTISLGTAHICRRRIELQVAA